MLDSLVKSIENTFIQFSFKRLLYICFLIALVLLSLYTFDRVTGYTLYTRIDRQISALERLHALEQQNIRQSKELAPMFESIIAQLNEPRTSFFDIHLSLEPIIKFFSAALIPFIFVIVGTINLLRKQQDAPSLFVGGLFITLIVGIPAILIPNWNSVWVNAIIYAFVQFIVLIAVSKYGNAVKHK